MDVLKRLTEYCKTAIPFLGMIYAAVASGCHLVARDQCT
jgi:hypothetical protein